MDHLTTINNGQVVVSSRQIADDFEKRHDNILRDIETLRKDSLKIEEMFHYHQEPDTYGRMQKSYLMNRDGFSILVMGFTGQKALEWKLKYIEAFNRMEKMLVEKAPSYQIADPIERAKVWIQEQEEKKALEGHIEELKPKALFADSVSSSRNSILVGELAKLLNQNGIDIGQKRLFQVLRDKGYLLKSGEDYNIPSQYSMDLKIMDIKKSSVNNPDGSVRITRTPKVTGKGQIYFVNKFLKGELN
jgi:anti-repressor protein